LKNVIFRTSGRQKDLRQLKRKRQYALEKLRNEAGPKWKDSKMAFVLSSVQTSLYEIETTLTFIQTSTTRILQIGPVCNGFQKPMLSLVDLSVQANYKCLVGMTKSMKETYNIPKTHYCNFVKQRTQDWMDIRTEARVTGITVYAAIGLDTLKSQQRHFDEVLRGKPKLELSDEIKSRMNYGCDNEVNAVVTLVHIIMPTCYPSLTFFVEGCYIIEQDSKTVCVVSPDGSLRINSKPQIAIEIKCPCKTDFMGCSTDPYH
ncbi:Hypothetical predicted protein, partial [Mytilus galloprovincialis]